MHTLLCQGVRCGSALFMSLYRIARLIPRAVLLVVKSITLCIIRLYPSSHRVCQRRRCNLHRTLSLLRCSVCGCHGVYSLSLSRPLSRPPLFQYSMYCEVVGPPAPLHEGQWPKWINPLSLSLSLSLDCDTILRPILLTAYSAAPPPPPPYCSL